MKALLAWFAVLLPMVFTSSAQIVDFRNNQVDFPTSADRDVYFPNGTPLVGTNFHARLLYGSDAQNLQPATMASPSRFRNVTTGAANAGTWTGGNRTLAGFTSGASVMLVVQAWDAGTNAQAQTFEQARDGGEFWGQSEPFTYTIAAPGSAPTAYYMNNLRSFKVGRCRGSIRITQPTNSAAFRGPATLTLEAENLGLPEPLTVSYAGLGIAATSSVAPFTFVATNLPVNDYFVQATALSEAGDLCVSEVVLVRVMAPPNPVIHPAAQIALRGATAVLAALPGGSEPNSYSWFFKGSYLPTQLSPSLVLTNVSDTDDGSYFVAVSNAVGTATSATAVLKVRPVIVYIDGQPVQTSSYTSSVPVMVSFQGSYPRGAIFYTLNGSAPDFTSEQYLEPFVVDRSVRLRAIGYSADFFESGEAEPVDVSVPPRRFLSASSDGGGSIATSPTSSSYLHGETVTLTAQPEEGWVFLEWRGEASGTNPVISLVMSSDRCVRALFGTTLTTTAVGGGRVVLDPPGGIYPYGTVVRLYAEPATNTYFVLWGNFASGSANPLDFPVTVPNPAISSAFAALPNNQVTLTALPDGNGQIDVVPRTNRYTRGQMVQLVASPVGKGTFVRWSGDAMGSDSTLVLTLDQSKIVTAHFSKTPHLISDPCHIGYNSEGFYGTLWGTWGVRYNIQYSAVLGDWLPLAVLENKYGTTQFKDSRATNSTQRSYRAVLVEP